MISGFVQINERKLYYEVTGEGYPLVLLHAAGMNRKMWDDQFELLSKYCKVIRYDARGAGESDVPQQPFSLSEDLYVLLRSLDISRAAILGLSLGGMTAIDFCLEHAEMVDVLVLVSAAISGFAFSPEYQEKITRLFLAAKEGGVSAFVEACLTDQALAPAQEHVTARRKMAEMLRENYKALFIDTKLALGLKPSAFERVSEITVPTLIMVGERDDLDFHTMGRVLRENIHSSQYVVISDAGHIINMEKPVEFNQTITDFLCKHWGNKNI